MKIANKSGLNLMGQDARSDPEGVLRAGQMSLKMTKGGDDRPLFW